jgi:hypothetical protein
MSRADGVQKMWDEARAALSSLREARRDRAQETPSGFTRSARSEGEAAAVQRPPADS